MSRPWKKLEEFLDAKTYSSYARFMVIELDFEEQLRLTELANGTQRSESDIVAEAMHYF